MTELLDELRIHRLLVAIDGSEPARLALRAAITAARRDHASLTLIHAVPDAADYSALALAAGAVPATGEELDAEAERLLREAVDAVPDDIPVRTVIARGRAGPAIVAEAAEGDYDAILLGARGLGPVGTLAGSVSSHVLHHATVAVFVAHPPRES